MKELQDKNNTIIGFSNATDNCSDESKKGINMFVTLTLKLVASMRAQQSLELLIFEERRKERTLRLQSRHYYVIERVAEFFNINIESVKEGVLDYSDYIELMDCFFAKKGRKTIMFYYQYGPPLEKECGRIVSGLSNKKRIYVTDGTDLQLNGNAVVCLRTNNSQTIVLSNIEKELIFALIEVKSNNLIEALSKLMEKVYIPAINANILENTCITRKEQVQNFLEDVNNLQNYLKDTSKFVSKYRQRSRGVNNFETG